MGSVLMPPVQKRTLTKVIKNGPQSAASKLAGEKRATKKD